MFPRLMNCHSLAKVNEKEGCSITEGTFLMLEGRGSQRLSCAVTPVSTLNIRTTLLPWNYPVTKSSNVQHKAER